MKAVLPIEGDMEDDSAKRHEEQDEIVGFVFLGHDMPFLFFFIVLLKNSCSNEPSDKGTDERAGAQPCKRIVTC